MFKPQNDEPQNLLTTASKKVWPDKTGDHKRQAATPSETVVSAFKIHQTITQLDNQTIRQSDTVVSAFQSNHQTIRQSDTVVSKAMGLLWILSLLASAASIPLSQVCNDCEGRLYLIEKCIVNRNNV